jgi:hypothetical protein
VATARVRVGCIDNERLEPAAVPPAMLAALKSLPIAAESKNQSR